MGGGDPHSRSKVSSDLPVSTLQQNESHSDTPPPSPPVNDLSDVFSSDSPPPPSDPLQDAHSDLHPPPRSQPELSDIPRLRQQHSTAGYRDGISAAKPAFIQAGFDVGYFLGGFIGARVGWLVGVLLGILRAVERGWEEKAREMGWDVEWRVGEKGDGRGEERWRMEVDRVRTWEKQASGELAMGNVVGEKYWDWAAEGKGEVWRFELRGENVEEVDWEEVVESHPLVVKWAARVDELVKVWTVDLGVLEEGDEHHGELKSSIVKGAVGAG